MSSEWRLTKLGSLVDIKHGFAFKGEFFTEAPTSYQLTTPGNFAIGGGFQSEKVKYYNGPVPSDFVLKAGDLLVTMTDLSKAADTLGYAAKVPPKAGGMWLHNQRVGLVGLKSGANASRDFLHYLMRSPDYRHWVVSTATGSTVKHTSPSRICDYEFLLPPIEVQQDIAITLGAIDDRITLLRETNSTLEAIAQALFKSWFVDFDPVRTKMAGRAPEGMDETTAALFPDALEETELGVVPHGWQLGAVGDIARLKKGTVNPGSQPDAMFEHFSLPAFDNGCRPVVEPGEAIKSNKTPVPSDAVLLSKLNPHIPRIWLPVSCGSNAVCSTEFLVFQPVGVGSKELIYCTFNSPDFILRLQQLVTGTSNSHQRIKPDQVELMSCAVPPKEIARQFELTMRPIFERVHTNRGQIQTLASLRDTLLPRLISGQLRLHEPQAFATGFAAH
jgi:type I restriction enzyme S subunit